MVFETNRRKFYTEKEYKKVDNRVKGIDTVSIDAAKPYFHGKVSIDNDKRKEERKEREKELSERRSIDLVSGNRTLTAITEAVMVTIREKWEELYASKESVEGVEALYASLSENIKHPVRNGSTTGIQFLQIPADGSQLPVWGAGGGANYSDFAFGYSVTGNIVTVTGGNVRHGSRTPIVVSETPITLAAATNWIYVSYTVASGVASILQSATEPITTEAIYKQPLHKWTSAGGVATVSLPILHLGDVSIPGAFG